MSKRLVLGTVVAGALAGLTYGYVELRAPYGAIAPPAAPKLWQPGEPVKPQAVLVEPSNPMGGQRRVVRGKSLVGGPQVVELPKPPRVARQINRLVYSCYFLRVIRPGQETEHCLPSPYPFERKLRGQRIIPAPYGKSTVEVIKAGKSTEEVIK